MSMAISPKHKRISAILGAAASIFILCVALWFLHRELAGLSREAIVNHIRSIPALALFAAAAFTACSYFVLTGYDRAALGYVGHPVPYARAALTSFMANAIGHNVGTTALSGGSIRFRMYSLAGLSASEIAQLIGFVSLTFGIGASGLLGVALLLMPGAQTAVLNVSPALVTLAGSLLLAVPLLYLAITISYRGSSLKIGAWRIAMPPPRTALLQVSLSAIDLTFTAAVLYALLQPVLDMPFSAFLGIYLLALAAGVISSLPGGIGVFEAVLVAALPQLDSSVLLGTIIVYRLVYYIAPLVLALLILVAHESHQHGRVLLRSTARAGDFLSGIAPQLVGATVFLAGVVLLLSGASPAVEARLALISQGIPLPVLELSHLAGSVIGVGLLILAHGLYRRLRGAYLAALATLAIGVVLSLLKGLDYEEALILGLIATILWFSRNEFYRNESIASERFSVRWVAAIVFALCLAVWVALVSFRHVEYSEQLWWQFAFDAQAPRVLRASLVTAVSALAFALWKILRGAAPPPAPAPSQDDNEQLRKVLLGARSSSANVALLGDKRFLWSADRQAFIMYQVSGNSWIAMGDPVGPANRQEELAWAFRELVDRHNGRAVFYQVTDEALHIYVDLGLTLSKLGEDARVPLADFSLQGSRRAELRYADNRAKKFGAVFEIVPRASLAPLLAELRRVSDNWLAEKSSAEKGFSLGAFSEQYLLNFDCAVVRVDAAVVAFANLWPAPAGGELSIDLMRYDRHAPGGVMDYLLVELLLWGAANGYQWFNLGMAPLSGLEQRPLAPLWHKLGNLVFTHGENFYNFEGLRKYKEKFDPEWQPRYLACPGGWWNLPRALFDASRLVSGGVSGMLGTRQPALVIASVAKQPGNSHS
jgi:phosphatidylglycerol lysyltransferase